MTTKPIHSFSADLLPPVGLDQVDQARPPEVITDRGFYLEVANTQMTRHLIEMLGTDQVPIMAPWPLPVVANGMISEHGVWGYAVEIERLDPDAFARLLEGAMAAHRELCRAMQAQGMEHLAGGKPCSHSREETERLLREMGPRIPPDDGTFLRVVYTRAVGEPLDVDPRADAMLDTYRRVTWHRTVPQDGVIAKKG